ncbi:Alpha/Beta hydrolase protein [Hypoxylon trugodes]|uniref:Alpha/Beta hydrolase protein n=1 Tax=Hypoxylon trugodes TaxID=326681 RepID=UPI00219029B1|nr:Alpha/Beta hydrolase protein [Hypoxylon trugodes]KAI1383913.1 Alpha/Beta hydrolase protein [Hypoxylon trugodes]
MIGTSLPEYIFIRTCIFLVQYTTPLCTACLALLAVSLGGLAPALSHPLGMVLATYSVLDVIYAVFIYIPHNRRLKEEARHPPPLTREERSQLFRRCFANVPDARRYLQMWFLGADESEIRRDNLRDFILWAFFDRWPGNESEDEEEELDGYVEAMENLLGRRLEPGRGKAEGLRLTLDEVETRYRSIAWYFVVGVVDLVSHCQLARNGFHYYAQSPSKVLPVIPPRLQNLFTSRYSESEGLSYWYRPHTATDKLPVVFLHGIGIGLYTYVPFLQRLNSESRGQDGQGQIGIIAIEMLPISFRLTEAPLGRPEFLEQIATVLNAHGWDKFVLVSHSYGTALATHMLRSEKLFDRISSVVLVDPVTILLHLPDVAYNFTRRRPRWANEWQLWYFASMDPGVAHCLGRHFFWKDNIVWKEELLGIEGRGSSPAELVGVDGGGGGGQGVRATATTGRPQRRRVAVCLAERDLIVDTLMVAQYLSADGEEGWVNTRSLTADNSGRDARPNKWSMEQDEWGAGYLTRDGIELLWFWGLDHAQAFDTKKNQDRLCSVIRRYCAE